MTLRSKCLVGMLLALVAAGTASFAQEDNAAVQTAMDKMLAAATKGDTAALTAMLHEGFAGAVVTTFGSPTVCDRDAFVKAVIEQATGAPAGLTVKLDTTETSGSLTFVKASVPVFGTQGPAFWAVLTEQGENLVGVAAVLDMEPTRTTDAVKERQSQELEEVLAGAMNFKEKGFAGLVDYLSPEACILGLDMNGVLNTVAGRDKVEGMVGGIPLPESVSLSNQKVEQGYGLASASMDLDLTMGGFTMKVKASAYLAKTKDGWKVFAATMIPQQG